MDLFNQTFFVIDSESTGLDYTRDKPIEVGVVALHPDGTIEPCYQSMINPNGTPISPEASAVCHIVDEDVADAPDYSLVKPFIEELNGVFVAHNAQHDKQMLGLDQRQWLCTDRLARHLWPDAPRYSNQVLRYWLKLDVSGHDDVRAHRAIGDAIVTAALFREEIMMMKADPKWNEIQTIDELTEKMNGPVLLKKVPFGKYRGCLWEDMDIGFLDWVEGKDFDQDVLFTARHWLHEKIQRDSVF